MERALPQGFKANPGLELANTFGVQVMTQRILLVEDEPGLVMTLTDRLTSEGYGVETAQDAESGLARSTRRLI